MSRGSIPIRKAVLIVAVAWILSLVTTLAVVYVSSSIIKDGTLTTNKIADSAVSNLKLGARAIPFNTTFRTEQVAKTTASWENITGMSVTITLERNSTLLIMFNTQASIQDKKTTQLPGKLWSIQRQPFQARFTCSLQEKEASGATFPATSMKTELVRENTLSTSNGW